MKNWIEDYIQQFKSAIDSVSPDDVAEWIEIFRKAHQQKRRIFV